MAINETFLKNFESDNKVANIAIIPEKGYLSQLLDINNSGNGYLLNVRLWDGPYNDESTEIYELDVRMAKSYLTTFFRIQTSKNELPVANLLDFIKYWSVHPLPVAYEVSDTYGDTLRPMTE